MSPNGTKVKERLNAFGKVFGCYGENITAYTADPVSIILQMLICDGWYDRRHRENLFCNDLKVCGISTLKSSSLNFVTVIDFAAAFGRQEDMALVKQQADEFYKEPAVFTENYEGAINSRTKTKMKVHGLLATKTVTKTWTFKDKTHT